MTTDSLAVDRARSAAKTPAARRYPVEWSRTCAGRTPGRTPSSDSAIATPVAAWTIESKPRRSPQGPAPQAFSVAWTTCGWISASSSEDRPYASSAPGR